MSAVNCFHQGDRVSLIADGGQYDTDYVLHSINSKIYELHGGRSAWALRGGQGFNELLQSRFEEAADFDQMVEWAPTAVRIFGSMQSLWYPGAPPEFFECRVTMIGGLRADRL